MIQVYHIERGLVEVDSVLGRHVLDKPCHYFAHAVLMHTLTAAFVSVIKEPYKSLTRALKRVAVLMHTLRAAFVACGAARAL